MRPTATTPTACRDATTPKVNTGSPSTTNAPIATASRAASTPALEHPVARFSSVPVARCLSQRLATVVHPLVKTKSKVSEKCANCAQVNLPQYLHVEPTAWSSNAGTLLLRAGLSFVRFGVKCLSRQLLAFLRLNKSLK